MAYVARPTDFHTACRALPRARQREARAGVCVRRLYDTIMENRQKSADRDIAAYLARRGNRMTDSVEREIDAQMVQRRMAERGARTKGRARLYAGL